MSFDEERNNSIGVVMGLRGTGKTLLALGSALSSKPSDKPLKLPGLIPMALQNGFKALVIDIMDHPSYRNIPILNQKDFKKWDSGARRIIVPEYQVESMIDLINTSPHMNNTLIICEDAGKYTGKVLKQSFKTLIAESKQRNIDLIFMYHCWADTPKDIFRKGIDFIQLFKTEDHVSVRKDDLRLYQKIEKAFEKVKENKVLYYSKYIDTRT